MSLPRKRKRLSESEPHDGNKQSGQTTIRSSGKPAPRVIARTEQMQKAFEIVDHIEHVHDDPDQPRPGVFNLSADHKDSPDPEGLRVRFSFDPIHTERHLPGDGSESPHSPIIEVKLSIPSFLWKVPVLSGITRTLIRKLSKEQS